MENDNATLELDHIAVLGETLDEAASHVERTLGAPMQPGGQHARFATHNRLLGLDPGLYLEAIAVDPSLPPPADARWFGLDRFTGPARLDKWVLRCDDLDAALRTFPMAGRPVSLSRGALSWSMAVPDDGQLPFDGVFPALMQWHSPVPPGKTLAASGLRLRALTLRHPEIDALRARLEPHLAKAPLRFEAGSPGLSAEIETGQGVVTLA